MPVILEDPSEYAELEDSGWSRTTNLFISTTTQARKWRSTYGGVRSLRCTTAATSNYASSPSFGDHGHLFLRMGIFLGEDTGTYGGTRILNASGTVAFTLVLSGLISAYLNTGTLLEDSGVELTPNRWYLFRVEMYQHDTNGVFKVWLDNELIIDFSGDTYDGATKMTKLELFGNDSMYYDDIIVHNTTMRYDTEASGPFTVGETITGTGGGAPTAIITALQDDGATGVLTLEGWDGTAFTDAQVITGGTSSTTAQVDAPNAAFIDGFEPNSGRPGNGFCVRGIPSANGANSGLTGSDGNSTDNYLLVDERITTGTPGDYVDATAVNQKDTYKYTHGMPATVNAILSVAVVDYAQSSLTGVDGLVHVVRIGGTDYDGDRIALGAGYGVAWSNLMLDPSIASGSDQTWLLATVTAAAFEFGKKFVA